MPELKGKLIVKYDTESFGANDYKVRKFVVEVVNTRNKEWNFPRLFQLTKDRCEILDACNIGDEVNVHYNLRGRAWEKDGRTMYFNTDEAWRIERLKDTSPPEFNAEDMPPPPETDDLPF